MEKRAGNPGERESLVDRIAQRRKMAEKVPGAAFLTDRKPDQQTFTPPAR